MDEITLLRDLDTEIATPDPIVKQKARAALQQRIEATSSKQPAIAVDAERGWVRRLAPRRAVVIAAAAAVLLISALVVGPTGLPGGSDAAYAATPPMLLSLDAPTTPARPILEDLAATAGSQPDLVNGRYHYLKSHTWYLHTTVSDGQGSSVVVPAITEKWIADDGSGLVIQTQGEPLQAAPPSAGADRRANRALPNDAGDATRYAPGGRHLHPTNSLPRDHEALRDALLTGNPDLADHEERFRALTDRLIDQRLEPDLLAAFYRVLADEPAMRSFGQVTDRAGRDAIAIGFESDSSGLPTRNLLLVDPDTGTPLGVEDILTTDAGRLNVQIPAVIGYASFLAGGEVDSTDRPGPPIP